MVPSAVALALVELAAAWPGLQAPSLSILERQGEQELQELQRLRKQTAARCPSLGAAAFLVRLVQLVGQEQVPLAPVQVPASHHF